MTNQERTNRHMMTARIVGVLILTATITYMLGSGLLDSILNAPDFLFHVHSNSNQVIIGALLKFVAAAANVSIGVVLFHLLKKHSETVAIGYVATRIFDGAGVVMGGIAALSLLALSQEMVQAGTQSTSYALALGNLLVAGSDTAFIVTMIALGVGSIPFCALLYRSRLIPRSLAALGIIGYVALAAGSSLELFGLDLQMMHYIPGGLFELFLPLWLIVKGFNSPAVSASANRTERDRIGLSQA